MFKKAIKTKSEEEDFTRNANIDDAINSRDAYGFIADIKKIGYEDGFCRATPARDIKGIKSAVQLVLEDIRIQVTARYDNIKDRIKRAESKLRDISKKKTKLEKQVERMKTRVKLADGVLYTLCGIIYILGDIEFSRQTIVVAWQLSHDYLFGRISLILAIAMASVLVKVFYERFIESRYEEGAKTQDKIVRIFFFILMPLFVFFFLQIAYMRSVIFEYSIVTHEIDIYNALFDEHPFVNMIAFVGISFMFLAAGGILISIGMKHLRRYYQFNRLCKDLRRVGENQIDLESDLETQYRLFQEIKAVYEQYCDKEFYKNLTETQVEFYYNEYLESYRRGRKDGEIAERNEKLRLQELLFQDSEHLPDNYHHIWVRKILDMRSRNGSSIEKVLNYG